MEVNTSRCCSKSAGSPRSRMTASPTCPSGGVDGDSTAQRHLMKSIALQGVAQKVTGPHLVRGARLPRADIVGENLRVLEGFGARLVLEQLRAGDGAVLVDEATFLQPTASLAGWKAD